MKATLKNTVGNVYEINKNGSFSSKTKRLVKSKNGEGNSNFLSVSNSKNEYLPSNNVNKISNSNKLKNSIYSSPLEDNNNGQKPPVSILNIIALLLILIIVLLISAVFFFKDKIFEHTKSFIKGAAKDEDEEKNVIDLKNRIAELEKKNKSIQIQKQSQIQKKKVDVKKFESYDHKQQVKSDGYCYIGYDSGIRECAPVYEGDICLSGEQYPRLDKCMVPKMIA